jgi:ketosteroid isomerase-like protein
MREEPDERIVVRMNDTITTPTALETVQAIYGAFATGDLDAMFGRFDPAIDWSMQVDAPGAELVPMLHHGIGHDAAHHYFGGAAELEFHVFDLVAFHEAGDVVLVELHLDATHRATGKRAALDEIHHWTVRDGLAVRYRPFVDTATLIELFRP